VKITITIDTHAIATHNHKADIGYEIRTVLYMLRQALRRADAGNPEARYAALTTQLRAGLVLVDDQGNACGTCQGDADFL
jgi:hypothetical protein